MNVHLQMQLQTPNQKSLRVGPGNLCFLKNSFFKTQLVYINWVSLVTQMVKKLPTIWETQVRSLGGVGYQSWIREYLTTSIFPPREFSGQRSLMGYSPWSHRRTGHDCMANTCTYISYQIEYKRPGTSLVVQWLGVHLTALGVHVRYLVGELRCYMPQSNWAHTAPTEPVPQLDNPHVATRDPTWHNEDPACHN